MAKSNSPCQGEARRLLLESKEDKAGACGRNDPGDKLTGDPVGVPEMAEEKGPTGKTQAAGETEEGITNDH